MGCATWYLRASQVHRANNPEGPEPFSSLAFGHVSPQICLCTCRTRGALAGLASYIILQHQIL